MKTTSSTTLRAAIAILSSLIIVIRGVFDDPATLAAARNTPRAFTRAYKLPFGTMLRIAFTNIRKNGTNLLNTFFNDILRNELPLEERTLIEDEILKGDVDRMPPTQQAYSKARAKMNHLPFKMAFESCIRFLYGEDQRSNLATAGGYYEFAIDGTLVPMPNLPVMAELYGTSGRANDSPTARMSLCYDTLNGFIFDPQFDSLDCSERELAIKHLEKVREVIPLEKCVFILDRGYVSMPILNSFINTYKTHFVMRVRRNFNDLVDAVPEPHGETIVDRVIEFPPTKKTGFAMLKVRVIKFLLDSGELETLITNLFDPCKEEFKALYFMRWKVEQENDVIKNKLELENFTGRTENTVLQDVWCAVLLSLICNACKTVMNLKIREQEIQKKVSFPEGICEQNDSAANRSGKSCQNRHEYKAKTTVIIHEAIPFIAGVIFRPDIHPFDREFELFRVFAGRSKVAYSDGTRTPERRVPRRTHYHHNRKSCTL